MTDPLFPDQEEITFKLSPEQKKAGRNWWCPLSNLMEVVLYLLLVLAAAKIFQPELGRRDELVAELQQLEVVRDLRASQVTRLRLEHRLLKTDKEFLETTARDRLDLQGPNEYIVRIQRDKSE